MIFKIRLKYYENGKDMRSEKREKITTRFTIVDALS
jgi:hypothetical protein